MAEIPLKLLGHEWGWRSHPVSFNVIGGFNRSLGVSHFPAYVIVDITVTDPEAYERYKADVLPSSLSTGVRISFAAANMRSSKKNRTPITLSCFASPTPTR